MRLMQIVAVRHPSGDDVIANEKRWIPVAPDADGKRSYVFFDKRISGADGAAQEAINYLNLVAAEMGRPRPHGVSDAELVFSRAEREAFVSMDAGEFADILGEGGNIRYVVAHDDVLAEARKRIMRGRGDEEPERPAKTMPKLKQPYKASIIKSKSPRVWKTPKDDKSLRVVDVEAVLPEPDKAVQVAGDLMRAFVYAAAQLNDKGTDVPDPKQEGAVITIDARVLDKARNILERIQRER